MPTYIFNHTKKCDWEKRTFANSKNDYREEDYSDPDLIPADILKAIDELDYRDLKEFDNNSPFRKKRNVQRL